LRRDVASIVRQTRHDDTTAYVCISRLSRSHASKRLG
jgi:hypothetical protein